MNDSEYNESIGRLSPARRRVFDAFQAHGPLTDDDLVEVVGRNRSSVIPRRSDLTREGLLRGAGRRASSTGQTKMTVWEVVPPAEVERYRQIADERGPRRAEIKRWPFEDRVRVATALICDPAVVEALQASTGFTSRKARSRRRNAIDGARRARTEAIKREELAHGELLAFLKLKDHLAKEVETVEQMGLVLDDEQERLRDHLPSRIPDSGWMQILEILHRGITVTGAVYDRVARYVGAPSRPGIEIIDTDGAALLPDGMPIKVVGSTDLPPGSD